MAVVGLGGARGRREAGGPGGEGAGISQDLFRTSHAWLGSLRSGPGELQLTADVALSMRRITRQASMRIAEAAFRGAMQRRRKVTAIQN